MRASILVILLLLFVIFVATAEEDNSWAPTAPLPDGELDFDWVRLTNGEWLKGELISLRDADLVFDSDEFGEQSLKLEDIEELYTMGPVTLVFQNNDTAVSRISVVGDTIMLRDTGEEFSRSSILSIIPAEATWWGLWEGKLSVSLASRSGNTNQTDLQIRADLVNRGAFNRFSLSYIGGFSIVEEIETANSHQANGEWDMFIWDRFYLTPLSYEFINNRYQNISQQHTPGIGIGYELFTGKIFNMDISGGGGYQFTSYYTVPAGDSIDDHSGLVLLGTTIEIDPTGDIELVYKYTLQLDVVNLTNHYHQSVAEFSIDLTRFLDFNFAVIWDYRNSPQPREDGSVPEKHDLNITAGIGFEF
jgi:putative salt-induced outer membrane protein YdiY